MSRVTDHWIRVLTMSLFSDLTEHRIMVRRWFRRVINRGMNKTLLVLQSRTFWTLVVTFLVNVGNLLVPTLPVMWQALLNVLLLAVATYYHVNPSQNYNDDSAKTVDKTVVDAKKTGGWVDHNTPDDPGNQGWKGH